MTRRAVAVVVALVVAALVIGRLLPETGRAPESSGVRYVSLAPPITETLFYLGKGIDLVGRSDWCTLPPEALALPALGSSLTPSIEAVVAARPTRVFVTEAEATQVEALEAVAPVEVLPWLTRDQAVASILRLGALSGAYERAEALAAELEETLSTEPPADAPRGLVVLGTPDLGSGELWFIRRDSLHGAAQAAAGLRFAVDEDVQGAPTLSIERLIALDPDVVVILVYEDITPEDRERLTHAFDALPLTAVREGRVGALSGDVLLSTGPGILTFVQALRDEVGRLQAPR